VSTVRSIGLCIVVFKVIADSDSLTSRLGRYWEEIVQWMKRWNNMKKWWVQSS
jgi:hypothetical protein